MIMLVPPEFFFLLAFLTLFCLEEIFSLFIWVFRISHFCYFKWVILTVKKREKKKKKRFSWSLC